MYQLSQLSIISKVNISYNFFKIPARSQSLNHAAATVSGLTTIRSTQEQQRILAQEFDKLQDLHSSSWTLVLTTGRAFGFWMDMACCLYLAAVTFSFFIFLDQSKLLIFALLAKYKLLMSLVFALCGIQHIEG